MNICLSIQLLDMGKIIDLMKKKEILQATLPDMEWANLDATI